MESDPRGNVGTYLFYLISMMPFSACFELLAS